MAVSPGYQLYLFVTHLFIWAPLVFILVWTYSFEINGKGLGWEKVPLFFWHPVLMYAAFGIFMAEAILAWRVLPLTHEVKKTIHAVLQTAGFIAGVLATIAIFEFHKQISAPDFYSVHSWMGTAVLAAGLLQYLSSVFIYWIPGLAPEGVKAALMPLHKNGGGYIYLGAIATMLTGVLQRQSFIRGAAGNFSLVAMWANVIALFIFIAGFLVYHHTFIPGVGGSNHAKAG